jgi:branched-chain amino acid transport system permease protein
VQTLSVAYLSAGMADAIVFSLLFLVLLFRPTGLFGGASAVARVTRR